MRIPAPRGRRLSFDVRPFEPDDVAQVLDLLHLLGGVADDDDSARCLAAKHLDGPFGRSLVVIAHDGGKTVALRLLMRWELDRDGRQLHALRPAEAVAHPEHASNTLFETLMMQAVARATSSTVDLLFDVAAGDDAAPSMGWHILGRLPVAVCTRSAPADVERSSGTELVRWSGDIEGGTSVGEWLAAGGWEHTAGRSTGARQVATRRDAEYLGWRYAFEADEHLVFSAGPATVVVRVRDGARREIVVCERFGPPAETDRLASALLVPLGADRVLRLGWRNVTGGFAAVPDSGPRLSWLGARQRIRPPLADWRLTMGDLVVGITSSRDGKM